jgi:hypothetical protein
MKKLKFLPLILAFAFPVSIMGQFSGFDLSKYKLPDIRLHKLDATFDFNNSMSKDHYTDVRYNRKSGQLQGLFNLDYYYFRNTEKYQGNIIISPGASFDDYKYSYDQEESEYRTKYIDFSFSSTNRFYNQKKNFIETDPKISVSDRVVNDISTPSIGPNVDHSYYNSSTSLSLPVAIGHGRIEPVQDLRLAIYILEEMNKAGRIRSIPPERTVLEMAKVISKIKNRRFFDSRIRKIKELQVIDSFLVSNDLISVNDINYFAVLNDQWSYASGPERSAGFAVSAGIDNYAIIGRRKDKTTSEGSQPMINKNYLNTFEAGAYARAQYYKPINLHWQLSGELRASYGLENTVNPRDREITNDNFTTNIFDTHLGCSVQYLPDSRTSVELNFSGNYKDLNGRTTATENYKKQGNISDFSAGFDMYYYVSPRLRITLNSYLTYYNYDWITYNIRWTVSNNTSLRLVYSFF